MTRHLLLGLLQLIGGFGGMILAASYYVATEKCPSWPPPPPPPPLRLLLEIAIPLILLGVLVALIVAGIDNLRRFEEMRCKIKVASNLTGNRLQ
jgi:hypothetical protein